MNLNNRRSQTLVKRKTKFWLILAGFIIGLIFLRSGKAILSYTSSDKYCVSCHIHPMADQNWKLSPHYNNRKGNIVHCVDCHLPPEGHGYLFAKAKHGFKDVYGYFFKDSSKINWQEKKLRWEKHYSYSNRLPPSVRSYLTQLLPMHRPLQHPR